MVDIDKWAEGMASFQTENGGFLRLTLIRPNDPTLLLRLLSREPYARTMVRAMGAALDSDFSDALCLACDHTFKNRKPHGFMFVVSGMNDTPHKAISIGICKRCCKKSDDFLHSVCCDLLERVYGKVVPLQPAGHA